MTTISISRFLVFCGIIILLTANTGHTQMAKLSFNNAFNLLNSGNKNGTSNTVYGSSNIVSIMGGSYNKKVSISYGIPIGIVLEYAIVKANLNSDFASDPDTYNNSPGNVQQAFDNLASADFVKISDYNQVNVKLNFRFNPAQLVIYGTLEDDYLNNTQSSPYDAKIYKMPNTAISGSKTMVIKK